MSATARVLAAILLTSLGLKLALLVPAHDIVPARDSADYALAAARMDEGRYDSIRPPLFPATLWVSRQIARAIGWDATWFGGGADLPPGPTHLDVARALVVLMSTLSAALAFALGRELFDQRAGLAAAALVAFYPEFVGYSHQLWADTQLVTLHLGFAWLLVAGWRHERAPWLLASGALLGLAALTRQVVLSFAALAALWPWAARPDAGRAALRAGAWVALGVALAVGPWTLRNALVLERFVPVSAIGGTTLLFGTTDAWESELRRAGIRPPITPEKDRRAGEIARQRIAEDPGAYARRVLTVNTTKLWGAGSLIVEAAQRPWGYGDFPRAWGRPLMLLLAGSYLLTTALGLVGMALAPRWRETLLFAGIVVHAIAVHAFFGSMHRHRFYLTPYFLVYAGFLVTRDAAEWRRLATPRRVRMALALLALFALLVAGSPWRRVAADWNAFAVPAPARQG